MWSVLMPAIYQLVPGAMIAKLWFSSMFPRPPEDDLDLVLDVINGTVRVPKTADADADIYSNLMVISTSLALGIIVGFTITAIWGRIWTHILSIFERTDDDLTEEEKEAKKEEKREKQRGRDIGAFTAHNIDPSEDKPVRDVTL
jgi:hypothetical protein